MKLEIEVKPIEINLNCRNVNADDFIYKQLAKLNHLMEKTMSKISEFADKMDAHNTASDAAIEGLTGDVAEMKRIIEEMQNSAGEITPEDQARLDALETRAAAATAKLVALDAMTPPVVPTTP